MLSSGMKKKTIEIAFYILSVKATSYVKLLHSSQPVFKVSLANKVIVTGNS